MVTKLSWGNWWGILKEFFYAADKRIMHMSLMDCQTLKGIRHFVLFVCHRAQHWQWKQCQNLRAFKATKPAK